MVSRDTGSEKSFTSALCIGIDFNESIIHEKSTCSSPQAVFERLVDIICDKMSESLDSDPNLLNNKGGTRLDSAQPSNVNCNC